MPTYEFICEECNLLVEKQFSIYTNATIWCEVCQLPMDRRFAAPAVHFKGKGWGKD